MSKTSCKTYFCAFSSAFTPCAIPSRSKHSSSPSRSGRPATRSAGRACLPDLRVVNADSRAQHALIHFYRTLDRINERDRTAFILRFIEGMEAAEVAAALDVSVPTARRCFTRAWERVTFFARRDPFLVDYLTALKVTSPEEGLNDSGGDRAQ
jgi:hypothetical protein